MKPRIVSIVAGISLCLAPAARAAIDTVTTAADSGPGSLRNAIASAGPGDTVVFSSTLAGQTIHLTSGELFIAQGLKIDASTLVRGISIDGDGNSRVLEVGSANVIFNALTVTNGYVSDDLGAGVLIDPAATLTAMNCVFCGNSGAEFGGAISSYGELTLDNCLISNNVAIVYGAGIFCYSGGITGSNCTFSANSVSGGGGGAIESEFSDLTLENCTLSGNAASIFAGGIDSDDDGTLNLTNCTFLNNSSGTAGAVLVETPATLVTCSFYDNSSTNGAGGAIANFDTLVLNNCTFSDNTIVNVYNVTNNDSLGGALINSGMLIMNSCTFSGNSAPYGSGGGIYNADTLTAANCTFSGNSATNGGALASLNATNVLINCTICSNSATYAGGGLFDNGSSVFTLTNTVAAANAATIFPDIAASYSGFGNFIGGNPQLASLGPYGGHTETMPPLFFSPLIDAGTDWVTNFLATDTRGLPRLAGAHVDIGAVEAQIAPVNNPPVLKNATYFPPGGFLESASFRFTFTNVANADFTVIASTNLTFPLARWTVLGNAQREPLPGDYGFMDIVPTAFGIGTNNSITVLVPKRFYRVVSP